MLKKISLEEVIQKSGSKAIYAVNLVDENTTLSDLKYAVAFYEEAEEEIKHEINQEWPEDDSEDDSEDETEAAEEKMPKSKPKKNGEVKRKPIDHGKICALWKGKWRAEDIADEMGCSLQTVYNHIDKEGLR